MDPFTKVIVTPSKVDSRSVRVVGNSESFNVTWDPVKNINYGSVFYEIQIEKHSKERNDSLVRKAIFKNYMFIFIYNF